MLGSVSLLGLVASAGAIMIPPNVALTSDPVLNMAISPESSSSSSSSPLTDPLRQMFLAECKSCPFATPNGDDFKWKDDIKNNLVLDISVGSNLKTIDLNGKTIYPQQPLQEAVFIPQVKSDITVNSIESTPAKYLSHPLRLESFSALASEVQSGESSEKVVRLELDIHRVEGKEVKVPHVVITAIKDGEGHLTLTKIESLESTPGDKCATLFCRFRAIMAAVSGGVKNKMIGKHPCPHHMGAKKPGHKAHHHKKPSISGFKTSMAHTKKPYHQTTTMEDLIAHYNQKQSGNGRSHGNNYYHHEQSRFHRFVHNIARVLLTIIVPIAVGVIAGMLTYVLGMALGTLVAFIWMSFRTATYTRIDLEDSYEDELFYQFESPEKDEYYEDDGFEAPPLYVEVEAREVRS